MVGRPVVVACESRKRLGVRRGVDPGRSENTMIFMKLYMKLV